MLVFYTNYSRINRYSALHYPSRCPPAPLRRLSNLGANREIPRRGQQLPLPHPDYRAILLLLDSECPRDSRASSDGSPARFHIRPETLSVPR